MTTVEIRKISITDLDTDAVVNAANSGLQAGGGVCGAIFKAAGYHRLQAACDQIGHCDVGSAVITPAFDLKAKYIIHAVGPRWVDGKSGEPDLLFNAYTRSLELARDHGCKSIGFPLISAGIFGYPVNRAWGQAFWACREFAEKNPEVSMKIVFAVRDDEILKIGKKELLDWAPNLKVAEKGDWTAYDMPEKHDSFILVRPFTPEQMQALRHGNIPEEMEDKWFWYMEGNTLYAHRSWTGYCIYVIQFSEDGRHPVTVNRDPEQYKCTDLAEDAKWLNSLLDWWSGTPYDHYNEWLAETYENLKKQGLIPEKLNINEKTVDAYFFHRTDEPNGYLSNWYPACFTLDGINYTSAEQYMMYQKAALFGDQAVAEAILKTDEPAEQKALGRKVSGYNSNVWAGIRQVIMLRGLEAKFAQNDDLKEKLLKTGDAYLVECAHKDIVWACGVGLQDEERHDISTWRGQNLLGFALMEVRRRMKAEAKEEK